MFVTKPRSFFAYALENHFAVPSFNVCNLETARAVVEAAEAEAAPVMLQTYFGDLHYGGFDVLPALLRILAEKAQVPVLVHQDHPDEDDMILKSLRQGYYSVMYDGGHLTLDSNIQGAAHIVKIAHVVGAAVEAELGLFGGEGEGHDVVKKATPEESKRLVEESGIDTLAVSVGSVHGQNSRLDLSLLESIANVTPAPLVIHGGSGIHPDDVREAVRLNVVKINIGAAVVKAWMEGLQEGAALETHHQPQHHVTMRHAGARVREVAQGRISLMGGSHHAEALTRVLNETAKDIPKVVAHPIQVMASPLR
jgi:fructose-bisphosphate aldolase class II